MSEAREMNINAKESPRNCGRCGSLTMTIDGSRQCPNCSTENEPKTGHTIIVTEPKGENGPAHVKFLDQKEIFVMEAEAVLEARKKAAAEQGEAGIGAADMSKAQAPVVAGTVLVHVPVSLFPDLVMWARKQKIPRDWKQAEKIKAITDFQIEINSKLGGLK